MRKPRIFIASAAESLDVADAINVNLDHQAEVTVWKHGFNLSLNTIDNLVKMAETVDFAIFVFTPDDITNIRDKNELVTRDNVVFEMGLFTGTLGKERCFIVKPRDEDLHLPTDLLGLTPADYNGKRSDNNLEAAVNHPCVLIKKEVDNLGLISNQLEIKEKTRRMINKNYTLGKVEHRFLSELLHRCTFDPDGIATSDIFNNIKNVDSGSLSIAAIKLERMGFLDKEICEDHQDGYSYYGLSITADGVDYILENEDLVSDANNFYKENKIDPDIPF